MPKKDKNRERRLRAEERLKARPDSSESTSGVNVDGLVHELRVHQIELEMQNEELRAAQVELEKVRDQYRDLYDSAPLAYYTLDLEGMITGVNPAGAALVGMDRKTLLASGFSRFVAESSHGEFHAIRDRAANTDAKQHCELELVQPGGTDATVHAAIARVANPAGGPALLRMALTDVTERKRGTEKTLRDSNERFHLLLHQASDAIYIHELHADRPGRFLDVNDSICRMLGYSREEMLAMEASDIRAPDSPAPMPETISELRARGSVIFASEHRTKDGRTIPFEVNASLFDLQGRTVVLAIARDITERRQTEERHERIARNLSQSNEELRQLVYAASHDLRTPLVGVTGFVSELRFALAELTKALRDPGIPPAVMERTAALIEKDIPESLKFVEAGVARMNVLLSGLLRLARLDRAALAIEELDMNRVAADVLAAAEFQIKEAGADVEVARLPSCFADGVMTGRLLSNLVDNAIKYRDPARPLMVHIFGQRVRAESVYCVADNGIGIPPGLLTKVFELFYRVSPKQGSGDGLGLTIIKRIADRLGGRVWVESEPGNGTRFFFALPASRPAV